MMWVMMGRARASRASGTSLMLVTIVVVFALLSCALVTPVKATRTLKQPAGGGCQYGWNPIAWLWCSTPTHSCSYEEVCRRCSYEDPSEGQAFWFRPALAPCYPGATLASTACINACGRGNFFCRLRCL